MQRQQVLEIQRKRQQGHGRPIISTEMNSKRVVVVGGRVTYGSWQTFTDFLLHYVRDALGSAWGGAEARKPEHDQHPFVRWMANLDALKKEHGRANGSLKTMPWFGAAQAVLNLAYELYLIEHHCHHENDRIAFQRLLERLRHRDQFFGARYEAKVAGILLRAGFDLAWEDEREGRPGGHGEFLAKFPQTGRSFWVECKMRQSDSDNGPAHFAHLISAALQKETNLERLVCVELNLPDGQVEKDGTGWPGWAVNQIRRLEGQQTAQQLPQALILVTNTPEHRYLRSVPTGAGVILEGFKTDRYRLGQHLELLDAIQHREDNPEIESLWRSLGEHTPIPTTFDGSLPLIDEARRLRIGNRYELPDGRIGVLEEATVAEEWRQAICAFHFTDSGERSLYKLDLTDEELHAWKRHSDTFFGEIRPQQRPATNLLEMYEFHREVYAETPREKLLEWMAGRPDVEELRHLPQPDLVKHYAYGMTVSLARQSGAPQSPEWLQRLKRPPRKPTTS